MFIRWAPELGQNDPERVHGVDLAQLKLDFGRKGPISCRVLIAESMCHIPNGITLQTANKMLITFASIKHPVGRLVSAYYRNFRKRMFDEPMMFVKLVIKAILEDQKSKVKVHKNKSLLYPESPSIYPTICHLRLLSAGISFGG